MRIKFELTAKWASGEVATSEHDSLIEAQAVVAFALNSPVLQSDFTPVMTIERIITMEV